MKTNSSRFGPRRAKAIYRVVAAALTTLLVAAGLTLTAGNAGAIVNGSTSSAAQRPFQVALMSGGENFCGGSIIDATTVVTAAHCLEGEPAAGTTIRAGVTDVTDSSGQDRQVSAMIPWPDYAQSQLGDIAVLKLSTPLVFGSTVAPIPLASSAELAAASAATVSGWGATSENDQVGSTQLLQVTLPLVDDATCIRQVGSDGPQEVCAGGTGADSCYGDSGGPLTISTASGEKLAGVVSWGEVCAGTTPGVYAEVPAFADFIANPGSAPASPAADAGQDFSDEDWEDEDWDDEDWDDQDWDGEDWDGEDWDGEDWDAYFDDGDFGYDYWDFEDFEDEDQG